MASSPRLAAPALVLLAVILLPLQCTRGASTCEDSQEGSLGFCESGSPTQEKDNGESMVLYANPASTCSKRVLLALLEKGVTGFRLEFINLERGEQKRPAYMELQPFGQIPALQDGNLTLFESRAIARYIAEKYEGRGTPLLGTTTQERALVNVWWEAESQEFNPQAGVIAFEMVIGPRYGNQPNHARVGAAVEKLKVVLDVYDEHLEEREYFAGERVSLADLSHMPYMAHLFAGGYGHLVHERPNLHRWWETVSSRPSWRRVLQGWP